MLDGRDSSWSRVHAWESGYSQEAQANGTSGDEGYAQTSMGC